jgi:N6-adenosine-specific RNA methylase IME4
MSQLDLLKVEEIEQAKKYQCVVTDFPWYYKLRPDDVTHRNRITYKPMKYEELKALPMPDLLDPSGGIAFMWYTANHMIEMAKLIEYWGFEHKGTFDWVKVSKAGTTRMGAGNWFRNSLEHCAIVKVGKIPAFCNVSKVASRTPNFLKTEEEVEDVLDDFPTELRAQRREHSRKPDEFYRLVEQVFNDVCPDANKLDMFTRQVREGWDAYGDQIDYFEAEKHD